MNRGQPPGQGQGDLAPLAGRVLHQDSAGYRGVSQDGALSIKTMRGGAALYQVGRARFRVDDMHLLVLNSGQSYEVDVLPRVESYCLFLDQRFAERTWSALHQSPLEALDEPSSTRALPEFEARTHAMTGALGRRLAQSRAHSRMNAAGVAHLEETLALEVLLSLISLERAGRAASDSLPWSRPATRLELTRRVRLAVAYIEACLFDPLPVSQLAEVAGLSPYHFIRAFRAVNGRTPHQYIVARRMEEARRLLHTGLPVGRVAAEVGYDSTTSFTAAYRRHHGHAPSAER